MPSPSLVVGRSSASIARGDQSGLGRRRGSLDPPAVPTDPEVVGGAEGQIPRVTTTAESAALVVPQDRVYHRGRGVGRAGWQETASGREEATRLISHAPTSGLKSSRASPWRDLADHCPARLLVAGRGGGDGVSGGHDDRDRASRAAPSSRAASGSFTAAPTSVSPSRTVRASTRSCSGLRTTTRRTWRGSRASGAASAFQRTTSTGGSRAHGPGNGCVRAHAALLRPCKREAANRLLWVSRAWETRPVRCRSLAGTWLARGRGRR